MTPKALRALKDSIKHWERLVKNPYEPIGPKVCPLCKAYKQLQEVSQHCVGCPVFKSTGVSYCNSTPYQDAWNARYRLVNHLDDRLTVQTNWITAATAELEFLKSLLPKPVSRRKNHAP